MPPLKVFLLSILLTIQTVQSIGDDYCYPAAKCIRDEFGNATSIDLGYCGASFACHNATSYNNRTLSDFGYCNAAHSCSLNTVKTAFTYYCEAHASCASLTIIPPLPTTALNFGYSMDCEADQACSHSYISGTNEISAYSAYSLFNSIVDSVNCVLSKYGGSDHLTVDLRGYHAGLGAKIICRDNHSCIIHCYANACFNLSLQCDGLCQVNVESVDTIEPIYVPQIDITPRDPFNHGFELLYDSYILSLENEEECSKLHRNFTFDLHDEALGVRSLHLTGGIHWEEDIPVCCRGSWSCEDVYNIISDTFTNQRTICSGSLACVYDEIIRNDNGPIFCSGQSACTPGSRGTIIDTSKSLYCGGWVSCAGSKLYNAERFICSGSGACRRTDIFTSGLSKTHYIYLLGQEGGAEATIHCLANDICYILCWAASACSETQLICDGTCIVECDKDSLCPYDSASLQYLYPTSAPTMIPTVDPTIEPTMDPSPDPTIDPTIDPTVDPTIDPTTDPTIDPTVDPTMYPTVDPTVEPTMIPTNDPSIYPTVDPTEEPSKSPLFSHSISMQFTAYIKLEEDEMDDKDVIEIKRQIVLTLHDSDIDVLRTDVFDNGVIVLDFIISTRLYTELEASIVAQIVEEELKDDVGDVQVSVVPYEAEIVTNNKRKSILYGLYNDIAILFMFAIIIATIACVVYCYLQIRKLKKSNQCIVELAKNVNNANDPMTVIPNMAEEVYVAQVRKPNGSSEMMHNEGDINKRVTNAYKTTQNGSDEVYVAQTRKRNDSEMMYNYEGDIKKRVTKTTQNEKQSEGANSNPKVPSMIANNDNPAALVSATGSNADNDDSAESVRGAVVITSDDANNDDSAAPVFSAGVGALITPDDDGDV